MKTVVVSLLFSLVLIPRAFAGTDLYSFPSVDDGKTPIVKKEEPDGDPFIAALAKKTGADEDDLQDAGLKGFGRTELIRLILMSQKSGRQLKDLMKERESGKSFKEMAKNLNLESKNIKKEADILYGQVLEELKAPRTPPQSPAPEKPKTAGAETF